MMPGAFRQYVPDLKDPKWTGLAQRSALSHAQHLFDTVSLVRELDREWRRLYSEPFKGITTDGNIIPGLYGSIDDEIDIKSIVEATEAFVQSLSSTDREKVLFELNAPQWRAWSNPEIYMNPFGLRLDETSIDIYRQVINIIKATVSSEGFDTVLSGMRINHFLGDIMGALGVLNQRSYNFLIFGTPSTTEPWGWLLYGHHLCLNLFLHGRQIVLSPTFTGAEPNEIDNGEYTGTRILAQEESLGLRFMQRLPSEMQKKAQTYKDMHDEAMPEGRWNLADQRHLCGAFQDNRIVPYEGINMTGVDAEERQLLLKIVEQFVRYLPDAARRNRIRLVEQHMDETYFSWIGGYGDDDAFYYRIQSPVIIAEFDHHPGVFLSNEEPAKFHIHTILRTPNGGDYGFAIR